MHCEYCDTTLFDIADTRRHILSMSHVRNKSSYELNMNKYFERSRQARIHPDNFEKLCVALNMHSKRDVMALEKDGFFKNDGRKERLWHFNVMEELIKVLMESGVKYHMNRLHPEVRTKLVQTLDEEKAEKEAQKEQSKS